MGRKSRFKRAFGRKLWLHADPGLALGRTLIAAQYSSRWRAFLLVGSVGLLALAVWIAIDGSLSDPQTILSLAVLLLFAVFGPLEVLLSRVVLAENGIEKRNLVGRIQRWSYQEVVSFEMHPEFVRVRFRNGNVLKVFEKMANPTLVVVYLRRYCPPVKADPKYARWIVAEPGDADD